MNLLCFFSFLTMVRNLFLRTVPNWKQPTTDVEVLQKEENISNKDDLGFIMYFYVAEAHIVSWTNFQFSPSFHEIQIHHPGSKQ